MCSHCFINKKTSSNKKPWTFGDFVAGGYRVWGKRKALGLIRLAIKAHVIEFQGHSRLVIS